MDHYDLGRLTDFDFEVLCKDILQESLSIPFEIFTPGPDGGVDLRHFLNKENKIIAQCKHWLKSTNSTLVSKLKKEELPKVKSLNPDRYILITTCSLTPDSKDKILEAFDPYIKNPADIIGLSEIVSFLGERKDIVRRHLRLWLSSASVLQSLISKGIFLRSSFLREEIEEATLTYVDNPSLRRAQDLLQEKNVCIISGLPGVGKTTLSHILSIQAMQEGYEVIEISENINEVYDAWDEEAPQLYLYDDFLGQTSIYEKLGKNEDSRILKTLSRVSRAHNKKFVLTTRDYILEQAKLRYEPVARFDFNPWKSLVNLDDYTPSIRAKILYNHVYFSSLDSDGKRQFAEKHYYQGIIGHRGFNPRLVTTAIDLFGQTALESNVTPAQFVLENLENPMRLWDHIVTEQIDEESVHLLEVMLIIQPCPLSLLKDAFFRYRSVLEIPSQSGDFRRSIQVLENSMVDISQSRGRESTVSYHNPSIRDYMEGRVREECRVLRNLVKSASTLREYASVRALVESSKSESIQSDEDLKSSFTERLDHFSNPDVSRESGYTAMILAERIKLSNIFDDPAMLELSFTLLDSGEYIGGWDDPESLVELTNSVFKSKSGAMKSYVEKVTLDATKFITDEMGDWDNATYAESMLQQIVAPIPQEVEEYVEASIVELIDNAFMEAESGEYDHSLGEMLEYVRQNGIDTYNSAAAQEMVDRANEEKVGIFSSSGFDGLARGSEAAQIKHIFSTLKDI
ncbi:nSTAND3 domain-containing NTPase [Nocardiopsis valliformis]|uniref:nSTAND3 domain-containing NTPase n=1 Tax=Nocardiopsis valliformis TaxID=239974 RepID=UPI0003484295|nr:restriction endonuclease [Nocardiopsis valliformis]